MRGGALHPNPRFKVARRTDSGLFPSVELSRWNLGSGRSAVVHTYGIAGAEAGHRAAGARITELNIDRGYIAGPLVDEVLGAGGQVICKPWVARNGKSFA